MDESRVGLKDRSSKPLRGRGVALFRAKFRIFRHFFSLFSCLFLFFFILFKKTFCIRASTRGCQTLELKSQVRCAPPRALSFRAMSRVLMHVSYYYHGGKFVAQCEAGEQCRVQTGEFQKNGAAFASLSRCHASILERRNLQRRL